MSAEIRISEVFIISMFTSASARDSQNVAVTPGWVRMPAPTRVTLPTCSSKMTSSWPTSACTAASASTAFGPSLTGSVNVTSVLPVFRCEMFCSTMSMLMSTSATARKMRAANPGWSGTPTTVTLASDRSCATPVRTACSTLSSSMDPTIVVPGWSVYDERTRSGTPSRRAYSTARRCSTFAPQAAISSISS